ncbi:unnamed protein product [Zymoseptoria tritici ST99CH_1A5]|uniref:RING-type domain-containing protein n=2 Tax=Zymoseptoria tritici TaxID=1047171 RepID=A0A1X7RET4_ZYMT9|nr:unnamed protein product [Zymoseptoria tritici ST99CH_3D7]SMY19590.1 unnamed protein product [Zymoseptoria tritici ST99CH_1A5]
MLRSSALPSVLGQAFDIKVGCCTGAEMSPTKFTTKISNITSGDLRHPVMTECLHDFCFECLYNWLCNSTKCPNCRFDLDEGREKRLNEQNVPTVEHGRVQATQQPVPADSENHLEAPPTSTAIDNALGRELEDRCRIRASESLRPRQSVAEPPPVRSVRSRSRDGQSHRLTVPTNGQAGGRTSMEDRADAALARHNGGIAPRNDSERYRAAQAASVVTVDSVLMITDMLRRRDELEATADVPLLWSESADAVLNEWRKFLHQHKGKTLLAKDLLEGMYEKFRQTLVNQGYLSHHVAVPERFDRFARHIAFAAVHGCP